MNGSLIKGSIHKIFQESQINFGQHCLIEGIITTYTKTATVSIGNHVFIGANSLIGSAGSITIEDYVLISFDCVIQDNDTHSLDSERRKHDISGWMDGNKDWTDIPIKPVRICKSAWIGAKAIILKGITVGEGAVVGAGSVVTHDVAPYTVVGGNPAKFIRSLNVEK